MQEKFFRKYVTGFLSRSHRRCSIKTTVLKTFTILEIKHLPWSLFLITLQTFKPTTLSKRDSNRDVSLRRASMNGYFWGSLHPLHVTGFFLYSLKTSENESIRYFEWVYKETIGINWVNTPLYKNKVIFVCVSVDQVLASNEKNVRNYKLRDLLLRRVSITGIKIKPYTFFTPLFGCPRGKLWSFFEGIASLSDINHCVLYDFNPKVTGSLMMKLVP